MMATCATFLVLPLRNLKTLVTKEDLERGFELHEHSIQVDSLAEYLDVIKMKLIMFFLGFLIICTIWEANTIRTMVTKRFDDFMVLLGILQMFAIAVLPFAISLQAHYPKDVLTIILTAITLVIINILELFMTIYAFSCPRLLHMAMASWDTSQRRRLMVVWCIKPVFDIILVAVISAFTLMETRLAILLFLILVLWPLVRKLVFYLGRRVVNETKQEKSRFFWHLSRGQISKERVEVFTDAAVAIIACVLVLDITVEDFPSLHDVKEMGLIAVLKHMDFEYYNFFGTYIAVTLLWYVNHTVLNLFHTIDYVSLYLQKIFLVFLCLAPLSNNMLTRFGSKGNYDTKVTMLWMFGTLFAAAITQFLMLIWGYWRKEKFLHQWAVSTSVKDAMSKKQHRYILLKTLTIPFWTFVGFLANCGKGNKPVIVVIACGVMTCLTFVVLKFLHMNHIGKEGVSRFLNINSQASDKDLYMSKEMQEEVDDGNTEFQTEDDYEKDTRLPKANKEKIPKHAYVNSMEGELKD